MSQNINQVDIGSKFGDDDYLLASIGGRLRRIPLSALSLASSWNDLKDRPFYTEEGEVTEVFPEATAVDASVATEFDTFVYSKDEEMCTVMSSVFVPIESGKTYTVKYNGVEYSCVAVYMEEDGIPINFLGDAYTMSGGELGTEPTGEPFGLMFLGDETMVSQSGMGMQGVPFDMPDSVTLAIYDGGEIIHKLENKYLDLDWLPVINRNMTTVFDETVSVLSQGINLYSSVPFEITVGETHLVTFGGTEYECVGMKEIVTTDVATYALYWIGNRRVGDPDNETIVDTGEPFCFSYIGIGESREQFVLRSSSDYYSTDVPITVKAPVYTPNKMPMEFLPKDFSTSYEMGDLSEVSIIQAEAAIEKGGRVSYNGNEVLYACSVEELKRFVMYCGENGLDLYGGSVYFQNGYGLTDGILTAALFPKNGVSVGQHLEVSHANSGGLVVFKAVDPVTYLYMDGTTDLYTDSACTKKALKADLDAAYKSRNLMVVWPMDDGSKKYYTPLSYTAQIASSNPSSLVVALAFDTTNGTATYHTFSVYS